MEIKEMTVEELEQRKAAIAEEIEKPEADLDALHEEVKSINSELEARKAAEAQKNEIRSAVADGEGVVKAKMQTEERKVMNMDEIRNSKEYIDAYAEYIKTEDPSECRALITPNGQSGTVAIPDYVYEVTKTAWEREDIMSRIRKTYIKGNLKIGYEVSSTPAVAHVEGGEPVAEEDLVLDTVEIMPASIKKWISISDEAMDLRGSEFIDYIYDELTYRIAKFAADSIVGRIISAAGEESSGPAVSKVVAPLSVGSVAKAMGQLSDEAANPVVIMNKSTWSAFKAAQYDAPHAVDPFEGLTVIFNNSVPVYGANTGEAYAIVGDLGHGALANFPNGEEVTIKIDDTTLMTQDLIRILGRMYVGLGVVAPNAFAVLASPTA